jgi:hypothetical protein
MKQILRTWLATFRRWRCSHDDEVLMEYLRTVGPIRQEAWKSGADGSVKLVEIDVFMSRVRFGCPCCGHIWIETIKEAVEV